MSNTPIDPPFIDGEAALFRPETIAEKGFTTRRITPQDTELWLKMGQLRADVYLSRGYVKETDINQDGAEYDEFDDHSDHFVALTDDNEMIGTVRVVNRGDGTLKLPAELDFGVELGERSQEISRLIRDPSLTPVEGALVSLSMMRATLKATVGKSDHIYAVLEPHLENELSNQIGIGLTTIAGPKAMPEYNNTVNSLVEMTPHLITSQIYQRDLRVIERRRTQPRLAEKIQGQMFAPFFERDSLHNGLGRVSLTDFRTANPDQFERNLGFYSREEQERLWNSTVAIAGAGGDGGELAITLARAGVRKFRLADPEVFEVENLNRQAGSGYDVVGHNKAEVVARYLRSLNAEVEVYTEGVTTENVSEFVKGADLVIDETEYTMPQLGVMLARAAREHELPVLMALNVGFGSYTTSFDPNGQTFEEYLGLKKDLPLEAYANEEISIGKWAPHIPSYAHISVLGKVLRGEMSTPTVVQGVHVAAGDAGTQAIMHLIDPVHGRWGKNIAWAPTGRSVDAIDGTRIVRSRQFEFARSVAIASFKSRFGKNEPKL